MRLLDCKFPDTLRSLTLGLRFNQSLETAEFPANLELPGDVLGAEEPQRSPRGTCAWARASTSPSTLRSCPRA